MLKLRLSRAAEQHLEDIWLYTISEWGEDQAEKYVALIEKAMSLLPDNPYLGKVRPDVKPGYRDLQPTFRAHVEEINQLIRERAKTMPYKIFIYT